MPRKAPSSPEQPKLTNGKMVIIAVFENGDMWLEKLRDAQVRYRLKVKLDGRLICDRLIPSGRSAISIFVAYWHRLKNANVKEAA